jgi:hypothetical protein
MMTDDLLSPADLFRHYQRGMLDQHSLHSQMLLNLIELSETQQAHGVLLEQMSLELTGLGQDIELIANLLRLQRPSQIGPVDADGDEAAEAGGA